MSAAQDRARGDARLLAHIPSPGFPASAYPHPNGNVYVGTYVNPNGSTQRSRVIEYTGNGQLSRSWTVPDQDLAAEHGIQVTTSDAKGRLVLLDRTPARALLLDTRTGEFSQYATFADLQPCSPAATADRCSPAAQDKPPMANYGAWGPDGSLYVTDYLQAVIWRVPPGGGAAQVWFADRRLDGNEFGTTGIALMADHTTLLIGQGSSATSLGLTNPSSGKLYKLPIHSDGKPGELAQLWESSPADLPDGFGIAASGKIYVALAGGNQIAVVGPDGKEAERFSSPLFDTPSSSKFLGTRLMVPNQSYLTADTTKMTLVDVETGERGLPELIPGRVDRADRAAPVLKRIGARRRTKGSVNVTFDLSEPAQVTVKLRRRQTGGWTTVRSALVSGTAGPNSVRLSLRGLSGQTCTVEVTAVDAAGNQSSRGSRRFRVR